MASGSYLKGITIEIGGDVSPLNKALSSVNTTSRSLQSELKAVNSLLKFDPSDTEALAKKQKILQEQLENSKSKLDLLKQAQAQVEAQFKAGKMGETEYRDFQTRVLYAEADVRKAEKAVADFAEECKESGKEAKEAGEDVEDAGKDAKEAGESSEKAGKQAEKSGQDAKSGGSGWEKFGSLAASAGKIAIASVTAVSGALAAGGAAAYKYGSEYETSLAKVSTIADTTAVSMDELSAGIIKASNETGVAAADLNEALYSSISAGVATANAVDFTATSVKLAKGGFTDTASAVDVMTTVLNAYGMSAKEAGKVSDTLIQIQNKGKTTVGELAANMGKAIPTANAFGVNLNNLGASYAILTANGIATAESTTYLNSMMNELGKSGTKASTKLKEVTGKTFEELMNSGMSLGEVLNELQKAADKSGVSMADMFGSAEAGKAAMVLSSQGVDAFNESVKDMANSAGTTEEAFEKMQNTTSAGIEKISNNFKNLGISIYNSASGEIAETVSVFAGLSEQLTDAFSEGGLSGLVEAFGDVLAQAVNYIVSFAPKMIEAALSLLKSFGSGIMNNADTLISSGMEVVNSLLEGIVGALPGLAAAAIELVGKLAAAIINEIPKLAQLGGQMLDNMSSGIKNGFGNFVDNALDLIEGFADSLTANLPILLQKGIEMLQNLAQGIANALPTLIERVPEIISKFANLINDNAPTILAAGVNIIITLVEGIIKAIPTLIANIPKIISAIVDVWSAFNWINLGKNAITFLKDGIVGMINAVKGAGKNVLEGITGSLSNLPNALKGLGKNAIEFLQSGISGMKSKAVSAAKGILDAVVSSIKTLPDKMLSIGKNIVQGLWDGIKNMTKWMTDKVKSFAGSILKGIKDALGIHSPSTVFRDLIGKNIVKGIAVGVDVETPNLQDTLESNITNVTAGLQAQVSVSGGNSDSVGGGTPSANLGGVHFHIDKFYNSTDKDLRQLVEESMEIAEEYIRRKGEVFA